MNMDEPGGHYETWNKPDTGKEIMHDLIYMWNVKSSDSWKQRIEWWMPGAECREKWGDVDQRIQNLSYER